MLSCPKVAKKHVHVYCFHGKHFTCWDLHGMFETDNFVQKDSKQTLRELCESRNLIPLLCFSERLAKITLLQISFGPNNLSQLKQCEAVFVGKSF